MKIPRYSAFRPANEHASIAARGASRKRDTACERLLRDALAARGIVPESDVASLPGRPDFVIADARVAIFVDGDFWHGRDLERRLTRLSSGHNARYWSAKIAANHARDRRNNRALVDAGWTVLRYWERDIRRDASAIAKEIARVVEVVRAVSP